MADIKNNDLVSKACSYCLKVFETNDESVLGCDDCGKEINELIQWGTMFNFLPKNLWERIRELEEEVKKLKENQSN